LKWSKLKQRQKELFVNNSTVILTRTERQNGKLYPSGIKQRGLNKNEVEIMQAKGLNIA
jgi:hypothetical protein